MKTLKIGLLINVFITYSCFASDLGIVTANNKVPILTEFSFIINFTFLHTCLAWVKAWQYCPVQSSGWYTMQSSGWYTVQYSGWYTVQSSGWYTVQSSGRYTVQYSGWYTVQSSGWYTVQSSGWYTVQYSGWNTVQSIRKS